jgi:hypothetical protein
MFLTRCVASSDPSPSRGGRRPGVAAREVLDVSNATAFLCCHFAAIVSPSPRRELDNDCRFVDERKPNLTRAQSIAGSKVVVQRHQQIYDAEKTHNANRNDLAGLRAAVRAGAVWAFCMFRGPVSGRLAPTATLWPWTCAPSGTAQGRQGRTIGSRSRAAARRHGTPRRRPERNAAPSRVQLDSQSAPAGPDRRSGRADRRLSACTVACCYTHSSLVLSMETLIAPVALTVMWAVSLT